jgi:hypothetical protein
MQTAMNEWVPFNLGKMILILGVVLVVVGLVVMAGSKVSFLGLGRLPGDIAYKGKNFSIYFPVVTCILLSAVLTLVLWLVSWITKR